MTLSIRSTLALTFLASCLLTTGCGDDDDRGTSSGSATLPQPAFPTVTEEILRAGAGRDWPVHGGNLANHRFSPLDQINRETVHALVPVWIHGTGIEGAFETTPVVVGNTLYATTAGGRVLALNAATGERLWMHTPSVDTVTLCCGPSNGGVSVYDNTVYVASPDATLWALDARSGEPAWEADLADPSAGYSATMAPLAADGRVFLGVAGRHYGIRGFLAAFDAETGEELWRWHTIPAADQEGWWGVGAETDPFGTPLNRDLEAEQAAREGTSGSWNIGGGGIATTPAYDPERGMLYVNVEGPAPLVNDAARPGDNLYTGSIVALDAGTGERAWHAQYLPHDVWGLSGGSPPFLFDRGGERYVGFAGRTGWIYVFDAATGRPVLRSDNFVPQESMFRRPTEEQAVRVAPGVNGGNPGTGVAYDPGSGTAFVGGVHQPTVYRTASQGYERGELWLGAEIRFAPEDDHWGTVTAVDLADGEIRWQRQTPNPVYSHALATGGGLVFMGQGGGTLDAFDATSGELLWQFSTGAGVHGGPVTYAVGGVQYIVVPAGGSVHFGTAPGDDLIAFALASQRAGTVTTRYETPSYQHSGPATAGQGGVRQVDAETGRTIRADTTDAADTGRPDSVDAAAGNAADRGRVDSVGGPG